LAKSVVVIVESPTKARTIEKFLGKEYDVLASYGHIRDLPNNASEIPADVKKEKWARLGVNVDKDFEPLYIIPDDKKSRVSDLKKAIKNADEILLATDEDREGESISWHLLEVLKPKVAPKRLVFHEITKSAIAKALESPRPLNEHLVKAQETRRVIDRLFGYSVSPLLWKKMLPRLSAGRVQSVAIKLLVERERDRIKFRRAIFWDLKATFKKLSVTGADAIKTDSFEAELTHVNDKRVASGKDFDPETGKLSGKSDVTHLEEKAAKELSKKLQNEKARVSSVEEKPYSTKPYPPFTTSTLQQEASIKLNFPARHTMSVAQKLYENGLITYMRTDSTTLSEEALVGARNLIAEDFGKNYLEDSPRIYKTKVRNAQEAHEAIRPAGASFTSPEAVKTKLGTDAFRLYELIWKRTIASQMKDARGTRISIQIKVGEATFRAAGKTIEFAGYLRAYVGGSEDPEAELADKEKLLPKLEKNEELDTKALEALEHSTLPPARYTEGSLIKELERLGIGRPSTWATIVGVVLSRTYAFKRGNALVPTFLAHAVIGLMERYFTKLVDYEFTANLEDDLDAIARGEADNLGYLKKFYFGNGHPGLESLVKTGEETIDPRDVCGIPLGLDAEGRRVEVRIGRYGPFITNGEDRASVPDSLAPDELNVEKAKEILVEAAKGPQSLGEHPELKKPVYLKTGRFGPYVQLGDQGEDKEKPKMVSLLPGMSTEDVDFETAVKLLELPKTLGKHPETEEEVVAATGRYGPYVKSGSETRSIPADDMSPITITFEQALELLKQPKRRGRTAQPKVLKELGKKDEDTVTLRSGRYGPYVTDGNVNASIPQGKDPDTTTLEEAIVLLEERAAKVGSKKKKAKKKAAPKKKAAAKKKAAPKKKTATKKKAAAKKTGTKKTTKKKSSTK